MIGPNRKIKEKSTNAGHLSEVKSGSAHKKQVKRKEMKETRKPVVAALTVVNLYLFLQTHLFPVHWGVEVLHQHCESPRAPEHSVAASHSDNILLLSAPSSGKNVGAVFSILGSVISLIFSFR